MYENLFHEEKAFQRETFLQRMQEYGFKNMGRMELFLWDLELFLQIQKILGGSNCLKRWGSNAVLPANRSTEDKC
ncbi:MAG: hypothetical protein PHY47_18235 [Lachnospiraceae bacterium]|nr:hypothetical protein [Lachnospiraceae bacterium]